MHDNNYLQFFLISLVLVLSPGPNTFLIFNTATTEGKIPAILNILGLVFATFIHGALSILGVSILLLKAPAVFFIVKALGAFYLCYLGIKMIRNAFLTSKKDNASSGHIEIKEEGPYKEVVFSQIFPYISKGFVTQILNPKVSIFYLSAFPQFININSASYQIQAFILNSIHAATISLWFLAMTLFVSKFRFAANNPKIAFTLQLVSGVVLLYFAVLLISYNHKL